jgi:hypothetical protein
MTKDDIIKLARDAGFNWPEIHTTTIEERLERLANLVAEHEREECAKVCAASQLIDYPTVFERVAISKCAAAIRARGNT